MRIKQNWIKMSVMMSRLVMKRGPHEHERNEKPIHESLDSSFKVNQLVKINGSKNGELISN